MRLERVSQIVVRTPEGVEFAFPLAGPATRFAALFIDWAIVIGLSLVVSQVVAWIGFVSSDLASALMIAATFIIGTCYGMTLEWIWRGQTIGKKVMRLRVVDQGGLTLTGSQVVLRNLLRTVDAIPIGYLVGGVSMLLTRRAQRLGDIAAGTVVVRQRRLREPDFGQLFVGKYNSLREQPHLAARLRQRVPPGLAAAAVGAMVRREQIESAQRVRLFAELAEAFQKIVPFPPEIVAGMPDETFVRNAVEIVHEVGARKSADGTAAPRADAKNLVGGVGAA